MTVLASPTATGGAKGDTFGGSMVREVYADGVYDWVAIDAGPRGRRMHWPSHGISVGVHGLAVVQAQTGGALVLAQATQALQPSFVVLATPDADTLYVATSELVLTDSTTLTDYTGYWLSDATPGALTSTEPDTSIPVCEMLAGGWARLIDWRPLDMATGPPVAGPYRYFRLDCLLNGNGSNHGIIFNEMELRDTAGVPQSMLGLGYFADGHFHEADGNPANVNYWRVDWLFNGTDSGPTEASGRNWASQGGTIFGTLNDMHYVGVEYTTVQTPATLWLRSTFTRRSNAPVDFDLKGSNDGSNYTLIKSVRGAIWATDGEAQEWTIP